MAQDLGYVERTSHQISGGIAQRLGIAEPPNVWRAFYAQVANETGYGEPTSIGVHYNNPLNLRPIAGGWPGQVGVSPEGFAIFGSRQAGIDATVQNYLASDYSGVIDAFRGGDPKRTVMAIEESPWDVTHYSGNLSSFLPGGSGGSPSGGGGTPATQSACLNTPAATITAIKGALNAIVGAGKRGGEAADELKAAFPGVPVACLQEIAYGQGSDGGGGGTLVNVSVPGFEQVGAFFGRLGGLFDPANWWRAGLVIGGAVSIFVGARLYLGEPAMVGGDVNTQAEHLEGVEKGTVFEKPT